MPPGWPAVPPQSFSFSPEDERETFDFDVKPPARISPGTAEIEAVARDASGTGTSSASCGGLPAHSSPLLTLHPSAMLRRAALALPRLTGRVTSWGAADRVPEALTASDFPSPCWTPTLEGGDLGRFDAIVMVLERRKDSALVENNRRLLDYARRGGLAFVQYQQQGFFDGGFAPFPMKVGGPPLPPPGSARQDIGILPFDSAGGPRPGDG